MAAALFFSYFAASPFFGANGRRQLRRTRSCCVVRANCGLPFAEENAKYYQHLRAAVDVVRRACDLCVEVQKSLFLSDGNVVQKMDRTPVTIADFGVQALVSLELGKEFPSIPLVAEEDSGFVQRNNLVEAVAKVVRENSILRYQELSHGSILKAIDRGGKDASSFGSEPATHWILDPIDGTRGFVKGNKALYVVGLALVVKGEIVLGVMGCPNWKDEAQDTVSSRRGIIMIAHVGCGTWRSKLPEHGESMTDEAWIRCSVDNFSEPYEASFCIPESQTWESLPLFKQYPAATTSAGSIRGRHIALLPICCGSLCKYLMVACGRASVFILRTKCSTASEMVWDHGVGVICVREAGGKVSDWKGGEVDFSGDKLGRRVLYPLGGILVSNGTILHDRILASSSFSGQ